MVVDIWNDSEVEVHRGDIFALGSHRLMCGDSTHAYEVSRLFDGESFSLCFTSPPYSDQRLYNRGTFDWHRMMCGAFDQMIEHGEPDCHILINLGLSHKNRQVNMYWLEWLLYCSGVGWPLFGWYVWDKGFGLPRANDGRLMSSHEFIFHFSQGDKLAYKWVKTQERTDSPHVALRCKDGTTMQKGLSSPHKIGQSHKVPDTVIRIPREMRRGIQNKHPAVFPVALPEFIMQTWSQPGDIVYEPFCGSGTSLIAGENLQRRVFACEISEEYCQLSIQRWQQATGQTARLLEPTYV